MSPENGTCSSIEYLDKIASSISNDAGIPRELRAKALLHVAQAKASSAAPVKLYRHLNEYPTELPDLTYGEVRRTRQLRDLEVFNCHNGQRKLTLSVLEFLAESLKKVPSSKQVLVVYAGASGLATTIASTLFPEIKFVLYDKMPNTVDLISKSFRDIAIHQQKHAVPDTSKKIVVYQAWFDDVEALKFSRLSDAFEVLFISDVRKDDTSELAIANDMRDQQRWAVLTGSSAYMFKFRIPYEWSPEIQKCYLDVGHMEAAVKQVGHKLALPKVGNSSSSSNNITYLDGDPFIQLYGRPNTAELRLIGFPKVSNKGVKTYNMSAYDGAEIENKMATFNCFYRSHARFWHGRHSPSFFATTFPGYEVVGEFAIASRCNQVMGKKQTIADLRETLDVLQRAISQFIAEKATPEQCSIKTSRKSKHVSAAATDQIAACARRSSGASTTGGGDSGKKKKTYLQTL